MADEKEFDIDKIKHGEFMDAKDRQYFEKYGSAMEEQAEIIEENIAEYMRYANEVYDSVLKNLYCNDKQYLVHGARLKCSKMAEAGTEQKLLDDGENEVISKPVLKERMFQLCVPETREESDNGRPFANASDTVGGLSGKLLTNGGILNITGFGNCKVLDEENIKTIGEIANRVYPLLVNSRGYNGATKAELSEKIKQAIKDNRGTCYCCMVLNSEWENPPTEYDYVDNTYDPELPMVGWCKVLDSKSYMKFDGREAINMMSMLFCRFGGGIINAEQSGQNIETLMVSERLWRDIKNMGYDNIATAAILGNISWESGGYDVGAIQSGDDPTRKDVGIGLCQWTIESRKKGLFQLGAELGLAWDTYELQIRYLEYELLEGDDFKSIRPEKMNEYTNVDSATEYFMWKFENPNKNKAHLKDRQERAREALEVYGGW